MRRAEKIIGVSLPTIDSIHSEPSHPSHGLFTLLPPDRRYRSFRASTRSLRNSFFPEAARLLKTMLPPNTHLGSSKTFTHHQPECWSSLTFHELLLSNLESDYLFAAHSILHVSIFSIFSLMTVNVLCLGHHFAFPRLHFPSLQSHSCCDN